MIKAVLAGSASLMVLSAQAQVPTPAAAITPTSAPAIALPMSC